VFQLSEPWAPGHRCTGKDRMGKAHYIEVYSDSDSDEDEEVEQAQDLGTSSIRRGVFIGWG
jgi:hypothetical protein